jgi:hypothetical protein
MNVEDGSYMGRMEVPFFDYAFTENGHTSNSRTLYTMLGVVKNGGVFFYFPVESGYSILFLNTNAGAGGDQRRGIIQVDSGELQFNTFDLSAEGILSALLVNNWEARLVWWRTDKFSGE